ncbi:stage II sporulation protein M [Cellulomonas triticagri]|uniref:Stage II sporulation protein M n=1 Tax=Cellulomonas triticagri TaxID=2483352 RepID=A0A3M2JUU7_9CELL|nr:stage II sporulation protein M [Cellulomonas triticagri]RMI13878.1 hypothetical protein EBM89_02595 [Cellulomonas triticagri]
MTGPAVEVARLAPDLAPRSPRGAALRGLVLGGARGADVTVAAVLALAIAGIGAAAGYGAYAPDPGQGGVVPGPGTLPSTVLTILGQNLGAVLLAFTGAMTWGLGTIAALLTTSAWVGATAHAVIAEIGAQEVVARVLPYVLLEFGGLLLAAAGGLYPVVVLVGSLFRGRPRPPFAVALRTSLGLLLTGMLLVVVGAVVEAALIVWTHPS